MKNKLGTLVLSVLIAFGLWLYVINVESPGSEKTFHDLPVKLINDNALQDRNLVVSRNYTPTVTLTLSGNRSVLNKLDDSNISITVDLSRIYNEGIQGWSYDIITPGDVPNTAYTVVSQSAASVRLNVEARISKEVPVDIRWIGTVAQDYMADFEALKLRRVSFEENFVIQDLETATNALTIRVVGPKSVVDLIQSAEVPVDITDRKEALIQDYEYTLVDGEGDPVDSALITTNADMVRLDLEIWRIKTIPLVFTVEDGGGATKQNSLITISPQDTITISGSEVALQNIVELNLGTIKLGQLTGEEEPQIISLTELIPEGVTNRSDLAEVSVTVTFPELKTATYAVTNFETINVPAQMTATVVNQQISNVTLRGPKELIDQLKAEDITAVIDFANANQGTATYGVTLRLPTAFNSVGAMGTYQVTATLEEIVPEETE